MKKVLILTDFKQHSLSAAKAGISLCGKLPANAILFNNHFYQPVSAPYAGGAWVAEDFVLLEEDRKKEAFLLEHELQSYTISWPSTLRRPHIERKFGEGDLSTNMEDILHGKDIELMVMGARSGNSFEHLLTGSETNAVINHALRPVLIMPEKATSEFKKVVLATDLNTEDLIAVRYLAALGKLLDFELDIVHVALYGEHDAGEAKIKKEFEAAVARFKHPQISFSEIRGKDTLDRLTRYCEENKSDLLALVHQQHGFFSRLLAEGVTSKVLNHQILPVLVIPANIEE
ncbi:universal stress protein [Mucilaginibacter paludis]|uniref:UspA domain-containing protein n=1 Tax=Mucilaginibacter paludis DSM 18603 TaxID=714943 RepID=H1YAR2_9SPHI|nr:universal stress protein [Mucilaginibacter paludis]EHQ29521.1 UspA domain-containing protein [Mucilaginibacter paludis DSM 18603]